MSAKSPSLNALRVFATAAQSKSFKHAATELGVSQSAITRHIQVLEEQLGTRLFQRDNRVHKLTAAGLALAPELQRLFRDLERAVQRTRDIGDHEVSLLKVAVPEAFLRFWLAPRLADFYSLYPHIRLQFTTHQMFMDSHSQADVSAALQREDIDVMMQYGHIRNKNLRQVELYTPSYLPITQTPLPHDEVFQLNWLAVTDSPTWPAFAKQYKSQVKEVVPTQANQLSVALDLIQTGRSVTLVDRLFCQHPQLKSAAIYPDLQIDLADSVYFTSRLRDSQPVAQIALQKWLQSRLQRS